MKQNKKSSENWDELCNILRQKQLRKLFAGETQNTLIQFFRYCFVGGGATVVDWGISALLFYLVFGQKFAILANALSFIAGLLANYFMSTFWVFTAEKAQTGKKRLLEFLVFAAIGVVGLLLTIGITKLSQMALGDITSAYQIIGKIVSTMVAFLWNFFARKYLLFNKDNTVQS